MRFFIVVRFFHRTIRAFGLAGLLPNEIHPFLVVENPDMGNRIVENPELPFAFSLLTFVFFGQRPRCPGFRGCATGFAALPSLLLGVLND